MSSRSSTCAINHVEAIIKCSKQNTLIIKTSSNIHYHSGELCCFSKYAITNHSKYTRTSKHMLSDLFVVIYNIFAPSVLVHLQVHFRNLDMGGVLQGIYDAHVGR